MQASATSAVLPPSVIAGYRRDGQLHDIRAVAPGSPAIPADDRCFLYGDGLFDTWRFGAGGYAPYALHHQHRIQAGCDAFGFPPPRLCVARITRMYARRFRLSGGVLRLHISAGSGGAGYARPARFDGRCVLSYRPLPVTGGPAALLALPVNGDASGVKHASRGAYCAAVTKARRSGYNDALFYNENGCLSEAGSSNIFAVFGKTLITPPVSCGALPGTARQRVIERAGGAAKEAPLSLASLQRADAVFLTNAVSGLRLVNRIDGAGFRMSSPVPAIFLRLRYAEEAAYASG